MKFTRLSICYRPLLFTLCMLCTCRVSRAGFERSCSTDRRYYRPRGICGTHLSFILSTVCSMYNKRGTLIPKLDTTDAPPSVDARSSMTTTTTVGHSTEATDNAIFLPRPEALSILKREFSIRGTITCECCIHRCNIMELRQYCSVPNPDLSIKHQLAALNPAKHGSDAYQDLIRKRTIGQTLVKPVIRPTGPATRGHGRNGQ